MKTSIDDFLDNLWEIKYAAVEKHLSTAEAIEELNNLKDEKNHVNCLIFLSAQENTTDLPPFDLESSNSSINRIVAVGLSETNLTKIVVPPRGVALSVSYNYTQNNVAEVVDAVLGREPSSTTPEIPTTKVSASTETSKVTTSEVPTTTQDPKVTTSELPVSKTSPEVNTESPETTSSIASTESPVPMKSNVHCLFAGDLLNFDRNTTAYEREKELITNIGKKLFETTANATGVVWAYGYTTGPAGLKTTFTAMKDNFVDFKNDVDTKMKYEAIEKPNLNNAAAINNLNDASDRNKNANCLVFFSGMKKAKGMDKLDPGKKGNNEFKKVVVVSISGADLRTIINPPRGAAVTVSRKFSEEDVRNVMEKILDANY
ncbi:hypothetical protein NECAME_16383 [Necator americanus]|uniref:Uncharacterized protein n=1 Tax=Necator americanus TaxID=51031 RepID=W2TXG4_NECAM|nr:hypothetical protein NECAME_16383 [Necator americanus]ETN86354.1 hypothetical protein NECAME_16383 [Necator americanus]